MRRTLTLVFCLLALVACSSPQKRLAADIAEAEELQRELDEERAEIAQKAAKRQINAYPDWANATPRSDGSGLYAVGVGKSSDLEIARKKAHLQANYAIAKQLNAEFAGGERMAAYDRDANASSDYQVLIDSLVDWVPVVGTETIKQEVEPIDGVFHAFVLVKMPFEEFNRVLQQRMRGAHDEAVRRDFQELHIRLEQLRQAKRDQAVTQRIERAPGSATPGVLEEVIAD